VAPEDFGNRGRQNVSVSETISMTKTASPVAAVQIASAVRIAPVGGFGRLLGRAPEVPAERSGARRLLLTADGDGKPKLVEKVNAGEANVPWAVYVRTEPWALELTFTKVTADEEGHDWDLVLSGTWSVVEAGRFLTECAAGMVSPESPCGPADLQAWLMGRIGYQVKEATDGYTVAQLRDSQALPAKFWEERFREWLGGVGLAATVSQAQFHSAAAAAAEVERRQREHARRLREERQRQREQEVAERQEVAEYERKLAEIEASAALSAEQRKAAADDLRRERELRAREHEIKRRETALELQRVEEQYESDVAKMREKLAEERLNRQREADAQFQERRRVAKIEEENLQQKLREERDRLSKLGALDAQAKLKDLEVREQEARAATARREAAFALQQKEASLRLEKLQVERDEAATAAKARLAADAARRQQQERDAAEHRERRARQDEERHREQIQQIRQDRQLSERERTLRIQQEELKLQQVRHEGQQAAVDAQRAASEHEARIRVLEAELKRYETLSKRDEQLAERFDKLQDWMANVTSNMGPILAALSSADRRQAHQAAEVITQDWGVKPEALQSVGFDVTTQVLVDTWTGKQERDGRPVKLSKRELIARDIGFKSINILKKGSRLNFTVRSERAGYVTVMNLGTSGKFYLMCPGSLCEPERARVEAGRGYEMPGPELFPFDGDLVESGPAGREHIVVVVSQKPLSLARRLGLGPDSPPIVAIEPGVLAATMAELEAAPEQWTAGVLSFDVE
jgi:hypothetical protein